MCHSYCMHVETAKKSMTTTNSECKLCTDLYKEFEDGYAGAMHYYAQQVHFPSNAVHLPRGNARCLESAVSLRVSK